MNKNLFKILLVIIFSLFLASLISFFLQKGVIKKEKENDLCVDLCGDNICQELVCFGSHCPCPESSITCQKDCGVD